MLISLLYDSGGVIRDALLANDIATAYGHIRAIAEEANVPRPVHGRGIFLVEGAANQYVAYVSQISPADLITLESLQRFAAVSDRPAFADAPADDAPSGPTGPPGDAEMLPSGSITLPDDPAHWYENLSIAPQLVAGPASQAETGQAREPSTPMQPYDSHDAEEGIAELLISTKHLAAAIGLPAGYRIVAVDQNPIQVRMGTVAITIAGPQSVSCWNVAVGGAIPQMQPNLHYACSQRRIDGAFDPEMHAYIHDRARQFDPKRGWHYPNDLPTGRDRVIQL